MSHTNQNTVPEPGIFGFCDWYAASDAMQPPLVGGASFTQSGSVLHGCALPVPLNATSTTPPPLTPCGSLYDPDLVRVPVVVSLTSIVNPKVALPVSNC